MQDFLRDLLVCLNQSSPNIYMKQRPGNAHIQSLIDLKIKTFDDCIPYLKALIPDQFSHHQASTLPHEAAAKRHLWIFGVVVGKPPSGNKPGKKQRAAYVKIQLGRTALEAVCISFHRPTSPLLFPFSAAYHTHFDSIYHA